MALAEAFSPSQAAGSWPRTRGEFDAWCRVTIASRTFGLLPSEQIPGCLQLRYATSVGAQPGDTEIFETGHVRKTDANARVRTEKSVGF